MRILGSPPRLSEGRAGAIAPETWLAPALGRGESWREAPERGYYRNAQTAPPLRHIVTPLPDAGRGKRTWDGARIFDNAKSCVQPPVSGRLNISDMNFKKSGSRRSRTDRSTRSGAAFSSAGGRLKAHRPRRRSRARANPAVQAGCRCLPRGTQF